MGAKQVLLSIDDVTYYLLPGGTGEVSREGAVIEDTVFGQTYKSGAVGPINWAVSANAIYKGYPGYVAKLLKPGASTLMTDEATTLVSGKTYRITSAAKRMMDRSAAIVVEDNTVDHTADVDNIDWLFGEVTFKSSYVVAGPVTVTANYFPTATLAKFTGYTLNMVADAIRDSDMPALQANNGYHTHTPGLKSVNIELPTVFNATDDWPNKLDDRAEYIIEVNPDGTGFSGSLARGFFHLMTQRQSGNVGALEEENLRFELNVPWDDGAPTIAKPFGWFHAAGSPIPTAIKNALTQWLADSPVYAEYLHDGAAGWKGAGVLTSLSLAGGMESPNTFQVNVQMSGAPTII